MKLLGPVALMVTELLRAWSEPATELLAELPLRTAGTAGVMGLPLLLPLALGAPVEDAALELMFALGVVGFLLLPALPFSGDTEAGRALLVLAFVGAEEEPTTTGDEDPVAITGVAAALPEAPAAEA